VPSSGGAGRQFGGSLSVHEIIAKIARFAVSKFAAFCYAVAVGVAGNVIFHFVQPRDPAPSVTPVVATAPHEAPPVAGAAATAPVSLPSMPTTPQADTAPAPTRASPPAAPVQPAASKPAAASASLPQPPAIVALPSPAAMPTPALKPTALPGLPPATVPREAPATPAALPPIGPAIEVAAPPMPPAATHALPAPVAALPLPAAPAATSKEAPGSLELSDVWHPYRAVKKGLHWAGEQVPLIGDGDAAPPPGPAAPSAPISLLPPAAKPATSENAEASIPPLKPAAPGPGSGGLY
jgi:hypothetical protein